MNIHERPFPSSPAGSGTARAKLSRRGFLTGTGAVLGGIAISGCAAGAKSTKKSGGKTKINVVGDPSEVTAEIIKDFEAKHPDIQVSLTQFSWDTVVSMLAAGTPPDLVRGAGATDTAYLAHRGLTEPLDDYLAKSSVLKVDNLDPINDLWRFDGKTQGAGPRYGLVKDYSSDLTLWVQKDHLDAAGIPLPGTTTPLTYDQLLTIAKKAFKTKGGRTAVFGTGAVFGGKPDFVWLQGMMATAGASPFSPDLSQVDLTSPAGVEAINWFIEVVTSRITSSFLNPQATHDTELYVANRMATLVSGYWTSGKIADAKPAVKAGSYLLPAPQMGGTRVSPCVGGTGMWMPKQSRNKEAAWTFMEYFFGGQPATDRAKTGWGVPSLKSLVNQLPTTEPYQKRALDTQLAEQKYFKVLPFTPYAKQEQLGTPFTTVFESGLRKKHPASQIAADATKTLNDILAKGRK